MRFSSFGKSEGIEHFRHKNTERNNIIALITAFSLLFLLAFPLAIISPNSFTFHQNTSAKYSSLGDQTTSYSQTNIGHKLVVSTINSPVPSVNEPRVISHLSPSNQLVNIPYALTTIYDSQDNLVYVVSNGTGSGAVLYELNPSTFQIVAMVPHVAIGPIAIATGQSKANKNLYIADHISDSITVVNGSNLTRIGILGIPVALALDNYTNELYIANFNDTVNVINCTTDQIVKNISMTSSPLGIAFDPINRRIYVTSVSIDGITILDDSTNQITGTIYTGGTTFSPIFASSSHQNIYAIVAANSSVYVIGLDTISDKIVTSIQDPYVLRLAFDATNGEIYTTTDFTTRIQAINAASNQIVANVAVGFHPSAITTDPGLDYVFVADEGDQSVYGGLSVVNGATNQVIYTIGPVLLRINSYILDSAPCLSNCTYDPPQATYSFNGTEYADSLGVENSTISIWVDAEAPLNISQSLDNNFTGQRWILSPSNSSVWNLTSSQSINFVYFHQDRVRFVYSFLVVAPEYLNQPLASYYEFGSNQTARISDSIVWADSGSSWTLTTSSISSTSTERWEPLYSSQGVIPDTLNNVTNLGAVYYHQYALFASYTFHSTNLTQSIPTPTIFIRELGADVGYSPGLNETAEYWADANSSWQLSPGQQSTLPSQRWAINQPTLGSVDSSETLNFVFYFQFVETLAYTVIGGGIGFSAPAIGYSSFGAQQTVKGNSSVWVDAVGYINYPLVLPGSTATERWSESGTSVVGGSSGTIYIEAYQHQYFLSAEANPSVGGSVSNATGWENSGATIRISVSAASHGWKFISWNGNGTGSYTGTNSTTNVVMFGPISELATFYAEVSINAPLGGQITYSYNSTQVAVSAGSSKVIYIPVGSNLTLSTVPSSFFFSFTGWNVTTSESSIQTMKGISMIISAPTTIIPIYSFNYFYEEIIILAVVVVAGIVVFSVLMRRRRRGITEPEPTEPSEVLVPAGIFRCC